MRILALGDVITPSAVDYLCSNLPAWRTRLGLDMVVINAENASFLAGISQEAALRLFEAGADVLTGGNHTLQNRTCHSFLDGCDRILRPLNYPCDAPGYGSTVQTIGTLSVLVLNAMGTAFIEPVLDSPYSYIEKALDRYRGQYDICLLDFHAEATGEKMALATSFDGRISAIWGTHTHIPTADAQVLPGGTGYITDLGCTAPTGGIMGVSGDVIRERFRTRMPIPYRPATGPIRAQGAIFEIDKDGKCRSVTQVTL